MIKKCELCNKQVKKCGRLMKEEWTRGTTIRLCKACSKKLEIERKMFL